MSAAHLIERVNAHLAADLYERNERWMLAEYAGYAAYLDPSDVATGTKVLRAWQDEIRRRWETILYTTRPSLNPEEKREIAQSAQDRFQEELEKLPNGSLRGAIVEEIKGIADDYARSLGAQIFDLLDEYSSPSEPHESSGSSRDTSSKTPPVFISHSSTDQDTAALLTDLLRAALPLSADQIRCTSVTGHDLRGGSDTADQLRREILEAGVLIGLISTHSVASSWVLFELGARWGADRPLIPCLAPGADLSKLPDPIRGRHALRCDRESDLHNLVETVARCLGLDAGPPTSYVRGIEALVKIGREVAASKARAAVEAFNPLGDKPAWSDHD